MLWGADSVEPAPQRDSDLHALERMKHALGGLYAVLAERKTALLLFIDDLQWADASSLELLESLALDEGEAPVLLIGAYRDNEVDAQHPLLQMIKRITQARVELVDLPLGGLHADDVRALVADVLDTTPASIDALARTLHQKTDGNAFFVLDYLRRLFDASQLWRVQGHWNHDAEALNALPSSDNLVEGLLEDLRRLPEAARELAAICACLGGSLDVSVLAAVLELPPAQVDESLLPLIRHDIVQLTRPDAGKRGDLRFCHVRMQQAAHALIDETTRQHWHLRIAGLDLEGLAVAADAIC